MHVEPFEVAAVADTAQFAAALGRAIARGNPKIHTPRRAEYTKPDILRYTNTRSLAQLERESRYWDISVRNENYEFMPWKRRRDRGWEEDRDAAVRFPRDLSLDDVLRRVVTLVQAGGPR